LRPACIKYVSFFKTSRAIISNSSTSWMGIWSYIDIISSKERSYEIWQTHLYTHTYLHVYTCTYTHTVDHTYTKFRLAPYLLQSLLHNSCLYRLP
jgi:hypothetical protein